MCFGLHLLVACGGIFKKVDAGSMLASEIIDTGSVLVMNFPKEERQIEVATVLVAHAVNAGAVTEIDLSSSFPLATFMVAPFTPFSRS